MNGKWLPLWSGVFLVLLLPVGGALGATEAVADPGQDASLSDPQPESSSAAMNIGPTAPPPPPPPRSRGNRTQDGLGNSSGDVPPLVVEPCGDHPCYYAGEVWDPWFESHPTSVEVSLDVPNHLPRVGDDYLVLLSVWDNAHHYDQIGLDTSGAGTWHVYYGFSDDCTVEGWWYNIFHADVVTRGQRHAFRMSIAGGNLQFQVLRRSVVVFTALFPTDASYFEAKERHQCINGGFAGYTNYEEIWHLASAQSVPEWNFHFYDNKMDNAPATGDWHPYYAGEVPSQVMALIYGDDMVVSNLFFGLSMTNGASFRILRGTTQFSQPGTVILVRDPLMCKFVSCRVDLFVNTNPPPGWVIWTDPINGVPTYQFTINFQIPWNTPVGVYGFELLAINVPRGQTTSFTLTITVMQSGGGGGCVASGSLIQTPSGSVPVQNLSIGSHVLSYDPVTQTFSESELLANNATEVDLTFVIYYSNNGSLRVTAQDQPIYFMNDTFTGWLENPQELLMGDLIYNPMTGLWLAVQGYDFVEGPVLVYSPTPSLAVRSFIAGDVLVKGKVP